MMYSWLVLYYGVTSFCDIVDTASVPGCGYLACAVDRHVVGSICS